ncbi:hypothetical protein PAECIP112173_01603 [Paenibacillus sp. JJ-100]|nr:hypothetical protein PAECIP112173_01603 [Paenibacillus sp. JJ-100]
MSLDSYNQYENAFVLFLIILQFNTFSLDVIFNK